MNSPHNLVPRAAPTASTSSAAVTAFVAVRPLLLRAPSVIAAWKEPRRPAGCSRRTPATTQRMSSLGKKPARLPDNAPGVLYVNDHCINCAACSNFAPAVFGRDAADRFHVVRTQPGDVAAGAGSEDDAALVFKHARQALAACPVAAIRLEARGPAADRNAVAKLVVRPPPRGENSAAPATPPFPRPFLDDPALSVLWTGSHSSATFGATPYLALGRHRGADVWVMVDTPAFTPAAVAAVEAVTGPKGPAYHVLTHVDDTAGHGRWAKHFTGASGGGCRRVIHRAETVAPHNWVGDETLATDVEIHVGTVEETELPPASLRAYTLDGDPVPDLDAWDADPAAGDFLLLHTPGHSPGSLTLYRRPRGAGGDDGIIFTGDTYVYSTLNGGAMSGMPQYGHDRRTQAETLRRLLQLRQGVWDWRIVAPGHGHPRDYRGRPAGDRAAEMEGALEELELYGRFRR